MRGRTHPGMVSLPPRYPGSFLVAFLAGAERQGWQVERILGTVALCLDDEGGLHQVDIENLYRRARRTLREEWVPLINEYLEAFASVEEGEDVAADLTSMSDRLLVRLARGNAHVPADAQIWSKSLGETGLVVNLVIDFPNRMCYVTQPLLDESGQDGDHWLQVAMSNLHQRTPPDCIQVVHEASGMCICNVGDAYDSSRALLAEEMLEEAITHGCLAVLPGRDELLLLPVTSRSLPHIHVMKLLAMKNFRQAPFPISEEVYWIHQGQWREFPIRIRSREVIVQPPPEFVPIMNELSEDCEDE